MVKSALANSRTNSRELPAATPEPTVHHSSWAPTRDRPKSRPRSRVSIGEENERMIRPTSPTMRVTHSRIRMWSSHQRRRRLTVKTAPTARPSGASLWFRTPFSCRSNRRSIAPRIWNVRGILGWWRRDNLRCKLTSLGQAWFIRAAPAPLAISSAPKTWVTSGKHRSCVSQSKRLATDPPSPTMQQGRLSQERRPEDSHFHPLLHRHSWSRIPRFGTQSQGLRYQILHCRGKLWHCGLELGKSLLNFANMYLLPTAHLLLSRPHPGPRCNSIPSSKPQELPFGLWRDFRSSCLHTWRVALGRHLLPIVVLRSMFRNHAGLMFFSDHGTPDGWINEHGYGCHTFKW